jgi:hypothetical protein
MCGGFSLSKTICFRRLEFIDDYFGNLSLSPRGVTQALSLWEHPAMGCHHCGPWSRTPPMSSARLLEEREAPFSPFPRYASRGHRLLPSQQHRGQRMLQPLRPWRWFHRGALHRGRTLGPLLSNDMPFGRGNEANLALNCNTLCHGLLNPCIRTLIKKQIKWILNF